MSADSVAVARPAIRQAGGGAIPTSALQLLQVTPISTGIAKDLLVREHYLHSLPGGTKLAFGVFIGSSLMGALSLGAGPFNAHSLVGYASPDDCLTLSRLWITDELPSNSESRVLGLVIRALRRDTSLKFLLTYADPAQGHLGIIYQASNWLYTGLSDAMPLYDLGDGRLRHSRSLSHAYGTHSMQHFADHGVDVKVVKQIRKHRYIYFLDPAWRSRLQVSVHPYPRALNTDKEVIQS